MGSGKIYVSLHVLIVGAMTSVRFCFGIVRLGALDVRASDINEEMKMAAAMALAAVIPEEELSEENIIPKPFDPRVVPAVAAAVAEAARKTGVARTLS